MKRNIKKVLSILAVALIIFTAVPFSVFAETHTHSFTVTTDNSGYHWKVCSCGLEIERECCYAVTINSCVLDGGALCSVCGSWCDNNYVSHSSVSYYDGTCGDCGISYELHDESYVHTWSGETFIRNETQHWYRCLCGVESGKQDHFGGTATCIERAKCTACGGYYGSLANHVDATNDDLCDNCGWEFPTTHDHIYETKSDSTYHWTECVICGEANIKSEHSTDGIDLTTCEICGMPLEHTHVYETKSDSTHHWTECDCGETTEKTAHNGGTATCTEQALCSVCSAPYGALTEHTDSNTDNKCDTCGVSVGMDEEQKVMTDSLWKTHANYAQKVTVGKNIYFTLWNDDTDKFIRTYYNCLVAYDSLMPDIGTLSQFGLEYNGVVTSNWGYAYQFTESYVDSGNQPSYRYNPYTDSTYNRIEVVVSFMKEGFHCDDNEVSYITYNYDTDNGERTCHGFVFNTQGSFDCTMLVYFHNDINGSYEVMRTNQTITAEFSEVAIKDAFDKGYVDGYKVGFENGKLSDEDFSLYGFINAIINAPAQFIESMLDFTVFGVNVASFVKMLFTGLLALFVVVVILRLVI